MPTQPLRRMDVWWRPFRPISQPRTRITPNTSCQPAAGCSPMIITPAGRSSSMCAIRCIRRLRLRSPTWADSCTLTRISACPTDMCWQRFSTHITALPSVVPARAAGWWRLMTMAKWSAPPLAPTQHFRILCSPRTASSFFLKLIAWSPYQPRRAAPRTGCSHLCADAGLRN